MVGCGKSMWRRPSPWPGTTELGSADEHNTKIIDGVMEGEVRSETGYKGSSYQHDEGLARVRSRGTPHGDLFRVSGAIPRSLKGSKNAKNGNTAA